MIGTILKRMRDSIAFINNFYQLIDALMFFFIFIKSAILNLMKITLFNSYLLSFAELKALVLILLFIVSKFCCLMFLKSYGTFGAGLNPGIFYFSILLINFIDFYFIVIF